MRSWLRGIEIKDILNKPSLFKHVILAMLDDDPVIRMRAADAAEKISKEQPTYLRPYKKILINRISHIDQQEVRWHAAQMLPRLQLTSKGENLPRFDGHRSYVISSKKGEGK